MVKTLRPGAKKGGRRPKELELDERSLSPVQQDKVKRRREKNKEAAARCRQKRLDTIQSLTEQVEALEAKNTELSTMVEQLANEKDELKFVLDLHQNVCSFRPPAPPPRVLVVSEATSTMMMNVDP